MINWAFITVLLLSIAGGVSSLFFILLEKVIYEKTDASFLVKIHTLMLFTFVVPTYKLFGLFDGSEAQFIYQQTAIFMEDNLQSKIFHSLNDVEAIHYLDEIWIFGVVLFLGKKIITYIAMISKIRKDSIPITEGYWCATLQGVRTEMGISNKVLLVESMKVREPCVTGIGEKYIIIPTELLGVFSQQEIKIILAHELMHIKRKDLLLKLLILGLNSLNWFNPLYYIIKNNLNKWMEARCDEQLSMRLTKEEQRSYVSTLIHTLEIQMKREEEIGKYAMHFGGEAELLKRRIEIIMKKKGMSQFGYKALVSAMTLCAVFSGSVVAKAADAPVNRLLVDNTHVVQQEGDARIVESMISSCVGELDAHTFEERILLGEIEPFAFQDSESVTYEIQYINEADALLFNNLQNISTRDILHNLVDVFFVEHYKHTDGACTNWYYNAKRCSKCGQVWIADLVETRVQERCNH